MASPICPATDTSFEFDKLITPYSNSLVNVQLRTDDNGIVLPNEMNKYIQSLKQAKKIPTLPRLSAAVTADFNPVTEYATQMKALVFK